MRLNYFKNRRSIVAGVFAALAIGVLATVFWLEGRCDTISSSIREDFEECLAHADSISAQYAGELLVIGRNSREFDLVVSHLRRAVRSGCRREDALPGGTEIQLLRNDGTDCAIVKLWPRYLEVQGQLLETSDLILVEYIFEDVDRQRRRQRSETN